MIAHDPIKAIYLFGLSRVPADLKDEAIAAYLAALKGERQ